MKTVILCGGSGTRLWPLSRTLYPKQFYPLFEGHSLFQRTIQRNIAHTEEFIIVVNAEQFFMAQDQFEALKLRIPASYILEPEGRNTAPAIALAAMSVLPAEMLLVVPSDHLIQDVKTYEQAVQNAKTLAESGSLVTFGIKPTHPETGFGYIESDGEKVKRFKEKPDLKTAQEYIASGHFFWNSGMFFFRSIDYLNALNNHAKEVFDSSLKAYRQAAGSNPLRIDPQLMKAIPSDSIDYAVMEKTEGIKMVPADMGWSDLGSFDALYEALPKDKDLNTIDKNLKVIGSSGNLIVSDQRLITLIDVKELLVVDTPDALLIAHKGSSQKVKDVVSTLKNENSHLIHVHTTAHRPWGSYTILEESAGFKVKRLVVKPGARLSLQKHAQRSEHWIVVEGVANITIGEKNLLLNKNESTFIPKGETHRIENKEKEDLVIIEAQVGVYLGEDDIVRIVDDYQRK